MSERPRVVHVVVAGDIGGAERLLVDLASRPSDSGVDHCIALMTPNPGLRAMFLDAGLRVCDRGAVRENPLAYLWRSFGPADVAWLADVLARERATIVHVHTFASHILGVRAAARRGLPVIRTEHGIRHYGDPTCSLFRHWALEKLDRIVAVCDYVGRFVAAVAPAIRNKISVIRNGVDATRFMASAPPAGGPFTLCVVCRLVPAKQVDLAIRAVARAADVRLIVVGDGSIRPGLEALARALRVEDRVSFRGHQRDPRPAMMESHAGLSTSGNEALSLSILEAMAMQRPVIALDVGGNPELVTPGETGWLLRDHTVEALAACLAEAQADPERTARYGVNGRSFVERQGRIEHMCEGYGRVYHDLAFPPSGSRFHP